MDKPILILFLLFFYPLKSWGNSIAIKNEPDSLMLVELFYALDGPNWESSFRWNLEKPMDTWKGICLNRNRRVTIIDLDGNTSNCDNPSFNPLSDLNPSSCNSGIGLKGALPQSFNFSELHTLVLSFGSINGALPSFEGAPKLKALVLHCNQFTGAIPNFNLLELEELYLSHNNLKDTIPNFDFCPNLKTIELRKNNLIGKIPPFNSLKNLTFLSLRGNELEGTIPSFENSPNLRSLYIIQNNFTFEDILPNYSFLKNIDLVEFRRQKPVYEPTFLTLPLGFPFTLDLGVDDTISTNTYFWIKEGDTIAVTNKNNLVLENISQENAGIYQCHIINDFINNTFNDSLKLISYPITIELCQPGIYQIDTFLCPEEDFIVNQLTYNENNSNGIQQLDNLAANGCDSFIIVNVEYPESAIPIPDTTSCQDNLMISNQNLAMEGKWTTYSTANIADPTNPITKVSNLIEGENLLVWTLSSDNCPRYDSVSMIVFYDKPPRAEVDEYTTFIGQSFEANIIENDDVDFSSDTLIITPFSFSNRFEFNEEGKFNFNPDSLFYGQFKFNYQLCSQLCPSFYCDTSVAIVSVIPENNPEIITPNEDGINDFFVIKELIVSTSDNNRLLIFNINGQVVYETTKYQNDWQGFNQAEQDLPEATYYYILWFDDLSTKPPISGSIAVLR